MSSSLHTPGLSPNPNSKQVRDRVHVLLYSIADYVVNRVIAGDVSKHSLNAAIQHYKYRAETQRRLCSDPSDVPVSCLTAVIRVTGLEYGRPGRHDIILTKVIDYMFSKTALASATDFIIPAKSRFCVDMPETGGIICGEPDLLIYDLKGRAVHIVEQKTAPTFDDYSLFVRRAAIQLAMYSWLFNEYYSGGVDWLKAYIVIIYYHTSVNLQARTEVIPLFIRLSNNIRDLMIDAYNALISKGLVTVDECRLAKVIYGEYADCSDSGAVLISAPKKKINVNRRANNLLFKRWGRVKRSKSTPNSETTTKEGVAPQ
jgi:hypothetical protein